MSQSDSNSGPWKLVAGILATITALVAANQIIKRINTPNELTKALSERKPKLSFLILGGRKVGKTSLIEWLDGMSKDQAIFSLADSYQPTLPQGGDGADLYVTLNKTQYNLAIPLDVSGDFGGPGSNWQDVYDDPNTILNGIIFMLDHNADTSIDYHQSAWETMNNIIVNNEGNSFKRNIKALYIIVNKSDLWENFDGGLTPYEIVSKYYENQFNLSQRIADRLDWSIKIAGISLKNETNVKDTLTSFANEIQASL